MPDVRRRKVMTVVGTRPELIKMSLVIARLDETFQHVLVHTGQNFDYGLNQVFFEDLGIRAPDHFLGAAGPTPAETIGRVIGRVDQLLEAEKPEAFLIYGDTNSGLSVIAAKRRKIPVFHLEAGNRCFDQRVPEELNRKIIDHLSDVNMVLTEHARRYLLAEGFPGDRIFTIGSNMAEVIARCRPQIERSTVLERLGLAHERFILVSAHREENVDVPARLAALVRTLTCLAAEFDMPIVVSTHPRTRQRLTALDSRDAGNAVRWLEPFGFTDYARLQLSAFCVVSDSGTLTEEASLLDVPAVAIRDAHERPEGMDAGTLVLSSLAPEAVVAAVRLARRGPPGRRFGGAVSNYEAAGASAAAVRIVASYIDLINRVVWGKCPSS